MKLVRNQGGFAYLAAVVLLIVVAGVVAAMLRLTTAQQTTANDAILIARAGQAARGGIEWMMYRVGAKADTPSSVCTLTNLADFVADTGFKVTVTCSYTGYYEGVDASGAAVLKNVFTISAVACNGPGAACPDDANAGLPDYVERRRVATICMRPVLGKDNFC